jgi:hypothetical protein
MMWVLMREMGIDAPVLKKNVPSYTTGQTFKLRTLGPGNAGQIW